MASWSNVIDREKWRLALLGGIEVRRASGNEEAGNGGSGAGGLSKPKMFHWTSQMYPYEYTEDMVASCTSMRPVPHLYVPDQLTVGASIIGTWSEGTIYSTYRLEEYLGVGATILGMTGSETIYSRTDASDNMISWINLLGVSLEKLLITYTPPDADMLTVGCTVRGET